MDSGSSSVATPKVSPDQFAESIKAKYPAYKDVDNKVLAQKMLEKYPQYKDKVATEETPAPPNRNFIQKVGDFLAPTATKSIEKLFSGQGIGLRDIAGSALEVGSFAIPAAAGARALGMGAKGIQALSTAQKAKALAVTGAATGGTSSAGRAIGEGKDVGGIVKDAAIGAGLGAATGAVLPVLPKAIGGATKALAPKKPTPVEAAGRVLQGEIRDQKLGTKILPKVDTEGVKTYSELSKRIQTEIDEGLAKVDETLGKDKKARTLDDLAQTITVGKGKDKLTGRTNYVETALEEMQGHYKAIGDTKKTLEIQRIINKARTKGLTPTEINKLAKQHGTDLNAFNANGQLSSGPSKQAVENTRKGLKETARSFIKGTKAAKTDKEVSDMIRVKELVDEAAEKVSALRQRIKERSLGAKLGAGAFRVFDLLTGGIAKGAIGAAFPSNVGLKTLNYLDLEKELAKNLEIIDSLGSAPDSAIIQFFQKFGRTGARRPGTRPKATGGVPSTPAQESGAPLSFVGGDYLYHGTPEINLDSITREGLRPGRRGVLSLSKDEAYSKSFAKTPDFYTVQKDGVMFRVKANWVKGKTSTPPKSRPTSDEINEVLTKKTIPPEALEILKDGKWQPLKPFSRPQRTKN